MSKKKNLDLQKRVLVALISGVILLLLLFLDQITKALAEATKVNQNSYFLGIVKLTYTSNPGIAFGMLSDNPAAMAVVTALTVVLIVGIAALFFTVFKKNTPVRVIFAIIEAGAIGNLIDRLCFQPSYVRDFVDVQPLHFGICNLADFYITFGAVALVFIILFIGKNAVFPLTKKWREEAKRDDEEKARKKGRGKK